MTNHIIPSIAAAALATFALTSALADEDIASREQAAKAATSAFVKNLGGALKQHMSEGGPAKAITVCRDIAPEIANDLSLEHGWKVTRVGTRVRNTMMGIPDAWEQAALAQFQKRRKDGETFAKMTYSEVVTEGDHRYFRFAKPIGIKPLCLNCHGGTADIPDTVQALLAEQYPHDQAIGYRVGELRGAVSIKQPMN